MKRQQLLSRIYWKFTIRNFVTRHHRQFHEWQAQRTEKRLANPQDTQLTLPLDQQPTY